MSVQQFLDLIKSTFTPEEISPTLTKYISKSVAVSHELTKIKQALLSLKIKDVPDDLIVGFDNTGYAYLIHNGLVIHDGSGLCIYPVGKPLNLNSYDYTTPVK